MQVSSSAAFLKPSPFQQRVSEQPQLVGSASASGSKFRVPRAPLLQANVASIGMQRPGTQGSDTRSTLLNNYKALQGKSSSKAGGKAPLNQLSTSKIFSANALIHNSLTKGVPVPIMSRASNRYASTENLLKETPVTAYSSGPKLKESATASKLKLDVMTPLSAQGRRADLRSSVESLSQVRQSFDKLPSARGVSSVAKSQSI